MVKRINEAFSDEDHAEMMERKENLKRQLGLSKLSWEKYLLHVTGVRKLDTNTGY